MARLFGRLKLSVERSSRPSIQHETEILDFRHNDSPNFAHPRESVRGMIFGAGCAAQLVGRRGRSGTCRQNYHFLLLCPYHVEANERCHIVSIGSCGLGIALGTSEPLASRPCAGCLVVGTESILVAGLAGELIVGGVNAQVY